MCGHIVHDEATGRPYHPRMKSIQRRAVYKIKDFMKEKKLSIGLLAAEAEIDKSYLSKILRGERRMNMEQLEEILKVLKLDPAELFKP
jgi:transcriptional regulator with XRE-family HTH domain